MSTRLLAGRYELIEKIGEGGMAVELPVLGELTIYPSDVDTLAQYIREA